MEDVVIAVQEWRIIALPIARDPEGQALTSML
jgi:hypothetical protein